MSTQKSIRRHLLAGGVAGLALVGGVGGWAATGRLAGAVIAPGQLVVDSSVKKIQHPSGGVVGTLPVRNGQHVKAGEIVMRLDDTQTRANLAIVDASLVELAARRVRNEAERDDTDELAFPADLEARAHGDKGSESQVAHALDGERRLFRLRRSARAGQKAQLRERIAQLEEEIRGTSIQEQSRGRELDSVAKELKGVRELWDKQLIPYARLTQLEREQARTEGERGRLVAAMAQSRGKISELELQILQIDQDLRTETGKELAEIRAKEAELVEKKVAAEDQLKRVDLHSPLDGIVHQLAVHTVGGVVQAGEPVMLVVPEHEALVVEARLQPQDIDQVRIGQTAMLRFSAFNQRTTPELAGTLAGISADVMQDQKTGQPYYTMRIVVSDDEMNKFAGFSLRAGMPVEAFVQTGERSVASYLVKPLGDQLARAMKER